MAKTLVHLTDNSVVTLDLELEYVINELLDENTGEFKAGSITVAGEDGKQNGVIFTKHIVKLSPR